MGQFFALRGARVLRSAGHASADAAERAALATLRRHPKSTVIITERVGRMTLETAEAAAVARRAARGKVELPMVGRLWGRPTSARPIVIKGFTFRCYRTGFNRIEWRTDCGRYAAGRRYNAVTYWAEQEAALKPRFQTLRAAMKAAVKGRQPPLMSDFGNMERSK